EIVPNKMPKYKVGDVAALFPKPSEPKTDSGKKIQSLFDEFYKKSSKKTEKPKQAPFEFKKKKRSSENSQNKKSQGKIQSEPKKKKRKYCDAEDPEGISKVNSKKAEKLECTAESTDESAFASVEKKALTNDEMYFPRNKKKSKKLNSMTGITSLFSEMTENTLFDKNNDFSSLSADNRQGGKLKKKKDKSDVNNSSDVDQIHKKIKTQPQDDESGAMNTMGKMLDQAASVKSHQKKWRAKKKNTINDKTAENQETLNDAQNSDDISSTENDFDQRSKMENDTKLNKKKFFLKKPEETSERLARTLFVGNLPVIISRQMLEKLFVPFGFVESCRLRGSVPTKSSIPKKVADIKMKFHDTQRSRIGYVVFKDENAAAQAMSLNGMLVGDHHIVVNKVSRDGEKTLYDKKRSIFIGNLPFNIDEDMIWNTFAECGPIEAVRVIRDRETGIGKGFGYVLFQKIQSKENALKLENLKVADRIIRIKEVQADPAKPKLTNQWCALKRKAMKIKKQGSKGNSKKSLKKIMKKERLNHQKKKCAEIFKKISIRSAVKK
ncbi:RNA-binding protein 34, partial [Trichonephila clavata]